MGADARGDINPGRKQAPPRQDKSCRGGYMREGLKKYVKIGENDKSKDISVNMKFSEPQEIGAIREKLNTSAGHVSVAQKYARYYTERQVRD